MTTLLELRTRARQKADMENSLFVSNPELNVYINQSLAELYDILINTNSEYFLSSTTITTTSDTLTLPSDFYKLKALDLQEGSLYTDLDPFNFQERNSTTGQVRYRLQGSSIKLVPEQDAPGSYRLWYIPKPATLTLDADTFDPINAYDEFIVVDAARKCLDKEESDSSALMNEKLMLTKRIQESASKRDVSKPKTIINVNPPFSYQNYSKLRRP